MREELHSDKDSQCPDDCKDVSGRCKESGIQERVDQ